MRTAVLVDPHPLWLEAVEQVLARIKVRVSGKATTFEEGTLLIEQFKPDIVIAEISDAAGDRDGRAWLDNLHHQLPDTKLIVLSVSDDVADINAALSAGAAAFVVKKAHPDDLAVAVRQAYDHSIYLPGILPQTSALFVDARSYGDLTKRELEILRLTADGHPNAELARMLWVTEQTVKFHLSNIYRKLGVSNRTEAARWAQVHGLLSSQPVSSSAA